MRHVRILGPAFVAALAFCLVGVASASAHEFVASKTGKTKAKGTNTQVFTTPTGSVECTKLSATGTVKKTKSKTEASTVKYSGCKAFGLTASVSTAKYLFNAEGSVKVTNTITVSVPSAKCSVKVGPTGNSNLKPISYVNKSGKIEVQANVKGITFTSTGGLCGKGGKTATYKGNALNELTGGTLQWK